MTDIVLPDDDGELTLSKHCHDYYDHTFKRRMHEIRNLESWKGIVYTEIYYGPVHRMNDSFWSFRLNLMAQPKNNSALWWQKRNSGLYYKVIKQKDIQKKAETICKKIIKEFEEELNIPIGINNCILLFLMADICVFKEFYINKFATAHDPFEILAPPPDSLIAQNIKWESKWKGPTGWEYKRPEQLFWYNYYEDYDKNGKRILPAVLMRLYGGYVTGDESE